MMMTFLWKIPDTVGANLAQMCPLFHDFANLLTVVNSRTKNHKSDPMLSGSCSAYIRQTLSTWPQFVCQFCTNNGALWTMRFATSKMKKSRSFSKKNCFWSMRPLRPRHDLSPRTSTMQLNRKSRRRREKRQEWLVFRLKIELENWPRSNMRCWSKPGQKRGQDTRSIRMKIRSKVRVVVVFSEYFKVCFASIKSLHPYEHLFSPHTFLL